jgi:predicted Zn-dependent protease
VHAGRRRARGGPGPDAAPLPGRDRADAVPFCERGLAAADPLTGDDRRDAYLALGGTYRVLGRHADAERLLRRATEEFPDDAALRTFLAMALFAGGSHHEAAGSLLGLLAATSEDPRVRRYRRQIADYGRGLAATGRTPGP